MVGEYLSKKGFDYKRVDRPGSGPQYIMNCPFCGDTDQKFAISVSHGAYRCYRENNCGVTGSFRQFQKLLGDEPKRQVSATKKAKEYPEIKKKSERFTNYPWFESRGISKDTVKTFKIGQEGPWIMFPYFKDGLLKGIKYRTPDKKFRKEKGSEPILFGRSNVSVNEIIIVEGEMDALAMWELGFRNAVSVPSGVNDQTWIDQEWEWLDQYKKIYLCLDSDQAGQSNVDKIAKRLGLHRCYKVILPHKDPNACLLAGMGYEDVKHYFMTAGEYTIDTIKRVSDYIDKVISITKDPDKMDGTPTGFTMLDKAIKGWRGGEITIWTGDSGAGKSTLLNQVLYNVTQIGEIAAVASLEMRPERLLRWLCVQKTDQTDKSITELLTRLSQAMVMVDIRGTADVDLILENFEFAARKHGATHYVLDSLMMVQLPGQDEYTAQKELMRRLRDFADEYDAHIHLVAHPRKAEGILGKNDIAGTKMITDIAHNVLILSTLDGKLQSEAKQRYSIVDPDAVLFVSKCREHGVGKLNKVFFRFNEQFKSFIEIVH